MFLRVTMWIGRIFMSIILFSGFTAWGQEGENHTRVSSKAGALVISKIHVAIEDDVDGRAYWIDMAKSVIFLKEGELFSPAALQASIDALKLCGQFKEIHVDSEEEHDAIDLLFRLKLSAYIKDIRIESMYPFFEREILNAMTLYPGDVYTDRELTRQLGLITEFVRKRGYFAPEVYVRARKDSKDGNYIIYIDLVKGPRYALDKIEIKGSQYFSDTRLKMKFRSWQFSVMPGISGRYIEKEIKDEIEGLTRFYRKKGFSDAKIGYTIDKDIESKYFSILINIDEGPKYEVAFSGNKAFWDLTLAKDLVLFTRGNKNNLGVRRSVRNMTARYREAGFLKARVQVKEILKNEQGMTIKQLEFVISEGPQSIVDSIDITGNQNVAPKKIKKQMLTRTPNLLNKGAYVPEVLDEDVAAIHTLYSREGFQNPQIREIVQFSKDQKKTTIGIEIKEGHQTLVADVEIKNLAVVSREEAFKKIRLKKGEPFQAHLVRIDENSLSALISEKGYPHVKVKGDVFESADGTAARVEYRVDEGASVKLGEIYCAGNFRTRERIIRNEIEIDSGEPYSLKKMLDSRRNIQGMNIFNSTHFKSIGLKEKQDTVNLFVNVAEKKPYYLELGAGYQSDTGFFAEAKAGDRNLFGTNKDAYAGFNYSEIGHRTDFAIKEPRFLGTRVGAKFDVFREVEEDFNKAFGTKTYGGSLGFFRKWFKHITTGITGRYELKDTYLIEALGPDESQSLYSDGEEETGVRSIVTLIPSIGYDTRDSFVRPRKGVSATVTVDISDGLDKTRDNEDSLDDFTKYRFDVKYYYTPVQFLTLAWHGRVGRIVPNNSMEWVLSDHLFFLGGTSDVRGFRENMLVYIDDTAVGGLSEVLGSMELRTDIGFNLELTCFFDTGRIYDTGDFFIDPELDGFRNSIGLGLRYFTPIGPVGVLYGWKLNPTQDEKERNDVGRLHLSIGYTF